MGKIIAIDLGTTKSCVAVMEGGLPRVIANQQGEPTTASVAAFEADGEFWCVGSPAKRLASTIPERTVSAALRLIGRSYGSQDLQQARRLLPYRLGRAASGEMHLQIGPWVYSASQIVAFVVRQLRAAAEDYLGETVGEAVTTVPAHSDSQHRQAIKDACLMAGLKVSRVISGSTAAARPNVPAAAARHS